jgi:hypothetical protein
MNVTKSVDVEERADEGAAVDGADLLRPLFREPVNRTESPSVGGVVVGELIAIVNDGRTPLVTFRGQAEPGAVSARSVIDLHGAHIGGHVVLMFDGGDPAKPIVMGVLRDRDGWPLERRPEQVEVSPDGERMVVTATNQLVLRCGKASITLTRAGKVIIQGTYLSNQSSGVNRIKGGSVQIN